MGENPGIGSYWRFDFRETWSGLSAVSRQSITGGNPAHSTATTRKWKGEAVSVLSAARLHQGDLSGQDITPVYLDGLEATIGEARNRTVQNAARLARLAYPASKAEKDEAILVTRNRFLLDEFPPRDRGKEEDTTPPPAPPIP